MNSDNIEQVKGLFSLQIYSLKMNTLIEKLISACYDTNTDVQDMLSALKDESVQQWPLHLKKKLQIAMSECKVIENRIYYHDHLWIPDDTVLRLQVMIRTHSSSAGGHVR